MLNHETILDTTVHLLQIIGMGFEHAMFYRPGAILVKREDSRMFEGFAQAVLSTFDFRRSKFLSYNQQLR